MSEILQGLTFNLASAIDATQTSIIVRNFKDSRGTAVTSISSAICFATLEPRSIANQEIISFTGITVNGNNLVTLTGVVRNLNPRSPYTTLGGLVPHSNNVECIISNTPAFYNNFLQTDSNAVITGNYTFPAPTTGNNPATKAYADGLSIAGAPDASNIAKGVSRLTVPPIVILGTVTITIATPAVASFTTHGLTADDSVKFTTNGALPTGLVVGTTYYVISVGLTANAFEVSATLGGAAVNTSGTQSGVHTLTKTTPLAVSDLDTRLLTIIQSQALAAGSDFGTPSTSNKFLTETFLVNRQKIDIFTASGTYTKPTNAKFVEVYCIGGGAGGAGGGGGNNTNTNYFGGGGGGAGGGGGVSRYGFTASILITTVPITVGAGGAGGAGGAPGNPGVGGLSGSDGADSLFGTYLIAKGGIKGGAGGGGNPATFGTTGAGGAGGLGLLFTGTVGGGSGSAGGTTSTFAPCGGGCGGVGSNGSGGSNATGGAGGGDQSLIIVAGGAAGGNGSVVSNTGGVGASVSTNYGKGGTGGGGGGGGGISVSAGGAGGAGGVYGAGGGGGGGGWIANGGTGGAGGGGIIIVITYM